MMGRRRDKNAPREWRNVQTASRQAIRDAVAEYAALRAAPGPYAATFPVTLRDGTEVTAAVTVNLIPPPTRQEPRP